jgi:hypothetical protein
VDLGSNLKRDNHYPDWGVCPGFLQSLHENSGISPQLRHDRLLPNPFQFICHLTFRRYADCDIESVVKQPINKARKSTSFSSALYLSVALEPLVGPWPLFQLLDLFTQSVGFL